MLNKNLLVIHGPNLNLLGTREPQIYGNTTLANINTKLHKFSVIKQISLVTFQSNCEGILVNRIQQAANENIKFIIINPAAYTHTSIAIIDALSSVSIPFIEVHISNIYQRENFRQKSYFSSKAHAVITGFGIRGYEFALEYAIGKLNENT